MFMAYENARAVLKARRSEQVGLFSPLRQELRAWPAFCDGQGHINNVTYFRIAQLGRIAWLTRAGLLRKLVTQRQAFILAGASITYRREIRRWSPFVLETELASYDARFVCFAFTMLLPSEHGEQVAARGITRAQVRGAGGVVAPEAWFASVGLKAPAEPPQAPSDLAAWLAAQEQSLLAIRERDGNRAAR